MKENINRVFRGLHKDSSKIDQPKDTYLFALNSVNETELGDFNFISNEESNELCASLPEDYIPIGKIYIGENRTVIFLVSEDEITSEIGILDGNCNYEPHVNDKLSSTEDKLNFKVSNQIEGTYRKRLGCEDTIYWTDGSEKPRYYNFNAPDKFKNRDKTWNSSLFSLQKQYSKIPIFLPEGIKVLDTGGNLTPGSINVAIQYVDASLNPTEWITSSPTVKIFNDYLDKEYREITGSINSEFDYLNFQKTSKSLRVEFANLDTDFLFYRLAFIESTNGTGQISSIKYTDIIPTTKNFFIYTGDNVEREGTEVEIQQFSEIVYKAKNILQLENRLLLGNTEGKQIDYCKLQKYASKIKADCVTEKVFLNSITNPYNSKNPVHEFNAIGYMPGEIYSFGIVYIFDDSTLSPVYHIPGKNPNLDSKTTFSKEGVYPMSIDNTCSSTYTDNSTCGSNNYWGRDSEGQLLKDTPIRHHRFPLRTDINKPLVTTADAGEQQDIIYYVLNLTIQGELFTPYPCPDETPDCDSENRVPFNVRVTYNVDNVEHFFSVNINPALYTNETDRATVEIFQTSKFHSSNNFTDIVVEMEDLNGDFQEVSPTPNSSVESLYWANTPTYEVVPEEYKDTTQDRVSTSELFGIQFSNIEIPSIEDTGGEKIIGYYIVRNERTEFDKTILDSGVLIPSVYNSKYISHGLLQPETNRVSSKVYGLIHPEHKFNSKEYTSYNKMIQQGNFNISKRLYGKVNFDDVYDGSSYDSGSQKDGNDDGESSDGSPTSRGYDGWSLNILSRDNIVAFESKKSFEILNTDFKDRFYLGALDNRSIDSDSKNIYNICTDNKVGIVNLGDDVNIPSGNNLPYVILKKDNADPYANFRVLPYYKETLNPIYFTEGETSTCSVFNGDVYVTPLRYVNTMYWNNRIAKRKGKSKVLRWLAGAILVVLGSLTLALGGSGVLLIGAGVALVGGGALLINSGIKLSNAQKIFSEEYDKGLRETTLDNWVDAFYNYKNNSYTQSFGFRGNGGDGGDGPSDDTIQWIGDCITDLWFESSVNMNLRNTMTSDVPTFLHAPGKIETGNKSPIWTWKYKKIFWTNSNAQRYPVSALERHLTRKLTAFDEKRDDNKLYLGIALGEYYSYNLDYSRRNTQKVYFHLPLQYDCCSECQEKFPHRWYWSEQSFQEELSDNFRIFLPNNYKDIEGETGEIVNMFKINEDLFLHTTEALWQQPKNYQERVTDQIVSFIGTGSYFEIPARKIVDDDSGNSAGLQHKWSTIKIPYGYFFVSENQKKIYKFDGKQLIPISDVGLSNWFKKNIEVLQDKSYCISSGEAYPYRDNPSNQFGTGFISTYDSNKERLIFTKRDFKFSDSILNNTDYKTCVDNGKVVVFNNFNDTIEQEALDGWEFVEIENCKMKFERTVLSTVLEERDVTVTLSDSVDIHVFLDTSGSFGDRDGSCLASIEDAVNLWVQNYGNTNPDWTGNVYIYQDGAERWLSYLDIITRDTYNNDTEDKDILLISFCNESNPSYHSLLISSTMTNPTQLYTQDLALFKSLYTKYKSFKGILYPIVFNTGATNCGGSVVSESLVNQSRNFLAHSVAAVFGKTMTNSDFVSELPVKNPGFTDNTWETLRTSLQTDNPYPDEGLKIYGWQGKWDRAVLEGDEVVIDANQFNDDINALLSISETTTNTEIVEITVESKEYKYVDGEIAEDSVNLDNSWTISYSLKNQSWISWHSYLPNFYIHTPEKMYSWIYGNRNIWKHNVVGNYQTFYGKYFPHILEYVSLSTPIVTRIWDYIKLITEAKRYMYEYDEYVDERFITYNKAILYNSRQCSGLMNLVPKEDTSDYLINQVVSSEDVSIDRNERDWTFNNFRDIRENYSLPIWDSSILSLQSEYFIDKVLNDSSLNADKDWTQLESFRDKYLVVRLIFDKFADIKLIANYSIEFENQSFR